jgi:enamine deaminase RidA (YjgF/YER057c/UK114 family)
VENPRQVPAYRYSRTYGPRAPTFSRAALADAGGGQLALLVSGTASIVGEHTVHHGDVVAQAHETLRNLQAVIESAHHGCSARYTLADLEPTVYVRHAADAVVVRQVLAQTEPSWREAPCVQADICRADLLVEIEAHGFAAGALA